MLEKHIMMPCINYRDYDRSPGGNIDVNTAEAIRFVECPFSCHTKYRALPPMLRLVVARRAFSRRSPPTPPRR